MERKLRKLENNLVVAGTGLMAFTVWSIIRALLFLLTYRKEFTEYITALSEEDGVEVPPVLVIIVVIFLLMLVALPYFIIGKSARTEGMGKKRKKFFIVLAMIMLIPQTIVVIASISSVFQSEDGLLESLVTAMIDVTTFCVLFETAITAIRIKKYRKQLDLEEAK